MVLGWQRPGRVGRRRIQFFWTVARLSVCVRRGHRFFPNDKSGGDGATDQTVNETTSDSTSKDESAPAESGDGSNNDGDGTTGDGSNNDDNGSDDDAPSADDGSDEAGIALAFAAYFTTYLNNGDPDSCEHQNVTTETRYAQATYTMNGVDSHTVTGYPYKHYKCNDCGFTWDDSYSMEQVTVTEPHMNYETWTDYVYGETDYAPDGQDGHKILGITVTCYQCTDCGQYWEGERSTEPVEG